MTFHVVSGPLPTELANTVSDALVVARRKGMELDEACCVALAVVCDYARGNYGDAFLNQLKKIVDAQKGRPLPAERRGER